MRRKRRNQGSWFPILPSYYGEGNPGVTWTDDTLTFVDAAIEEGATVIKAIPLTVDETIDQDAAGGDVTLRDYVQGQDYVAKRIVGNAWFNAPKTSGERVIRSVCCLAIAVLPVDTAGQTPDIGAEEWNPLFSQNAQRPWLWRRCWHLSNPTLTNGFSAVWSVDQYSGGVKGGGVVDTKGTYRRITKDQRLFMIAAAGILEAAVGPGESDSHWQFGYDLRLFGQMRAARNRSTFK